MFREVTKNKNREKTIWHIPLTKFKDDKSNSLGNILNKKDINEYKVDNKPLEQQDTKQFTIKDIYDIIVKTNELTHKETNTSIQKEIFKKNVRIVEMEPSSFCNRKCSFCANSFIDRTSQNIEMPEDIFIKLLEELKDINYSNTFSLNRYNEPLANREFILKRIKMVKDYIPNAKIGLFTNGDYLNKTYVRDLESAGLSYMHISFYLKDNEKFDKENIIHKRMCEVFNKINIRKYYQDISTDTEYILKAKHKKMLIIYRALNFEEAAFDKGGTIKEFRTLERSEPCFQLFNQFYIDYNGNVMICAHVRSDVLEHTPYSIGNIKDNSIFEIFTGEKASEFRRVLALRGNEKMPPCKTCQVYKYSLFEDLYTVFSKKFL